MNHPPVVRLLADLVSIPSMNPMGRDVPPGEYSEAQIAEFLKSYLERNRIDVTVTGDHRPNVEGYVDAGAEKTLLLEAHMDTVHAQGMSIEPFSPVVKDGRLHGRGACDTKGSMAAFLEGVTSVLRSGRRPRYNVRLLFVSDEEYRFTGAQAAVGRGWKADLGIAGEPTGLAIVRAHKGVTRWKIRAEGVAAHSAFPERGRNAVYLMGEVIRRLEHYADELARQAVDPELGPATLSIGVIEGGTAVNVVPDTCRIEIDRRTLPGEKEADVLGPVKALLNGLEQAHCDPPYLSVRGMSVPESSEVVRELSEAILRSGRTPALATAPYATDAGFYNAAGIPTVVFGPGDIAQAHTDNEYIRLDELTAAVDIVKMLVTGEK